MSINIMFKNMKGFFYVLQCPKCKKIVFLKEPLEENEIPMCCECLVKLRKLDIETAKVEIEL